MEKKKDFVAIIVKTLQKRAINGEDYNALPVRIAMAKYKNGQPECKTFDRFIKPPVEGIWYSRGSDEISDKDCKNADAYDSTHQEIVDYIEDLPLVIFSGNHVKKAFSEACSYYGLENPFKKWEYIDVYRQLLAKYKFPIPNLDPELSALARWVMCFDLDREEWIPSYAPHDAEMLAELYLHLHDFDAEKMLVKKEKNPGCYQKKGEDKDKSLFGDPIPVDEVIYPDNPFNRKYICVTGFDCEIENIINWKMKQLGAGRLDEVSGKLNILIPTPGYMRKYGFKEKGKMGKVVGKKNKQVMFVQELKDILQTYDMYDGELDSLL